MPLSLTRMLSSTGHLTLQSFSVLIWQLSDWVKGKEITKDESDCVGKGHIFEGHVIQEERFELCFVGNRH